VRKIFGNAVDKKITQMLKIQIFKVFGSMQKLFLLITNTREAGGLLWEN